MDVRHTNHLHDRLLMDHINFRIHLHKDLHRDYLINNHPNHLMVDLKVIRLDYSNCDINHTILHIC